MHETHAIERELRQEAEGLSQRYDGAPVVIIVGGNQRAGVPRCMLGSSLQGRRLRDLLGILEAAKQIVTLKHFRVGPFAEPTSQAPEVETDEVG